MRSPEPGGTHVYVTGRPDAMARSADGRGEVIDHPDLAVGAGGDGGGLEANGNRAGVDQPILLDAEDLETIIGSVDGEQVLSIG
jgi:hypothetical protein